MNEENEQKWKWRQRRRLQLGQRTGEPLCYSGQSLSLSSTLSSKWVSETRHPLHCHHHHHHHHHQVKSVSLNFVKCRLIFEIKHLFISSDDFDDILILFIITRSD